MKTLKNLGKAFVVVICILVTSLILFILGVTFVGAMHENEHARAVIYDASQTDEK